MVSHRDERALLSKRPAHRLTCAGFCRPGIALRESLSKREDQRQPQQAACAARDVRTGMRAFSRAIREAPIRILIGRAVEFRNEESPRWRKNDED